MLTSQVNGNFRELSTGWYVTELSKLNVPCAVFRRTLEFPSSRACPTYLLFVVVTRGRSCRREGGKGEMTVAKGDKREAGRVVGTKKQPAKQNCK